MTPSHCPNSIQKKNMLGYYLRFFNISLWTRFEFDSTRFEMFNTGRKTPVRDGDGEITHTCALMKSSP